MSRTTRRAGLGVVAAIVLLSLAVPAWAYFSLSSTAATAAGRAAALGTPGASTSNVTASSVTVSATPPAGGPTPTGYRVARTLPTAVASVCTITGATGSCADSSPVAGSTNTYAVYAVLSGTSWESPTPGAASAAVPSADSTPPVTTASQSPAPNGAGWNSSDVVVTLSATDASGVAGTWYTTNGSDPTTASTAYTGAFNLTSSTTVKFFSKDTVGNTEAVKSVALQVDKVAPSVAVTSPAANSLNGGSVTVSGTASDSGSGLAGLTVQYAPSGSTTWTTIGSPTVSGGGWSIPWATSALPDGGYSLQVVGADVAGNTTTSPSVAVSLKNTFSISGVPATATAGASFPVTVSTYPGYTGSKTLTISGTASPSASQPTVTSPVTFNNGSAVVTVSLTAKGAQTFVLRDANVSTMTATSGPVTVAAGAAARLAWTTFLAQGVTQPISTCYFTCTAVIGNQSLATTNVSVTDTQGNIVSDLGTARTVNVSAPTPSGGAPAGAQTLTIPATGPATSGTPQWNFKDNGNWTQYSFTATSAGLTQASLTVKKQ